MSWLTWTVDVRLDDTTPVRILTYADSLLDGHPPLAPTCWPPACRHSPARGAVLVGSKVQASKVPAMLMSGPPRGPSHPGQGSSSASVRLDHGHSQLGLELSRMQLSPSPPPQLQLAEARDDSAKIPLMTTTYIPSHVGCLSQGFALASGLVSHTPPAALYSISLHVAPARPVLRAESFLRAPDFFCFLSSR
jgi:hypothetical protein